MLDLLPSEIIVKEILKYLDTKSRYFLKITSRRYDSLISTIDLRSSCTDSEYERKKRINRLRYDNPMWRIFQNREDLAGMTWSALSQSSSITWDIVQANPDKPWNWYSLSINPNITIEMIESSMNKPWPTYISVERPKNMRKKEFALYQLKLDIERSNISPEEKAQKERIMKIVVNDVFKDEPDEEIEEEITDNYIEKYGIKCINFSVVGKNPNITWEIVERYCHTFDKAIWKLISQNSGITWSDTRNNLNQP
jgi:hypothetical protein